MSVLLLNASYEPLRVITWQRAICLQLADRADLVDVVESFIAEMLMLVAVNYFGYAREEVIGLPDFRIADERFVADAYRPQDTTPSVERSTERPPRQW